MFIFVSVIENIVAYIIKQYIFPPDHVFLLYQDVCAARPCGVNGDCKPADNTDRYTCECKYGWRGDRCDVPGEYIHLNHLKVQQPTLGDFISEMSILTILRPMKTISFQSVVYNCAEVSSRLHTIYRQPKCRTQKLLISFFPYYMSALNKVFHFYVPIQFYRMLIHGL